MENEIVISLLIMKRGYYFDDIGLKGSELSSLQQGCACRGNDPLPSLFLSLGSNLGGENDTLLLLAPGEHALLGPCTLPSSL